jgi:rhamnosyltransferase
MKRLTIYAHYGRSSQVAGHVLFYLQHLAGMGFQICFVSNSEISPASETNLKKICERVIVRENVGLDFAMWQRGISEYDLLQFDELLLTNSSIIGPLQPLAPLWQNPAVADCDFWGLTDNDELNRHLQSYFLVFRKRVLHSRRFEEFWRSALPYKSKWQVIFSYEIGLSNWLEEGGFTGKVVFETKAIIASYQKARDSRSFFKKCRDYYLYPNRRKQGRNTTVIFPDLLLQRGMPFVKAALLNESSSPMKPPVAFSILEKSGLPVEILEELRQEFPAVTDGAKSRAARASRCAILEATLEQLNSDKRSSPQTRSET